MKFLEASGIEVHFPIYKGIFRRVSGEVKAVDGVSFELKKGEVLSIIGESGSGKTTLGNAVLGLYPPAGRGSPGRYRRYSRTPTVRSTPA